MKIDYSRVSEISIYIFGLCIFLIIFYYVIVSNVTFNLINGQLQKVIQQMFGSLAGKVPASIISGFENMLEQMKHTSNFNNVFNAAQDQNGIAITNAVIIFTLFSTIPLLISIFISYKFNINWFHSFLEALPYIIVSASSETIFLFAFISRIVVFDESTLSYALFNSLLTT